MFYRVGVVNWAVLIKKNIKQWTLFSIQQLRFKTFIHGSQLEPLYPLPYPQKLSDRTGFVQNLGFSEARAWNGRGTGVERAKPGFRQQAC